MQSGRLADEPVYVIPNQAYNLTSTCSRLDGGPVQPASNPGSLSSPGFIETILNPPALTYWNGTVTSDLAASNTVGAFLYTNLEE
jgi:hypothetical protein